MTEKKKRNIIGFFASYEEGEQDIETLNSFLWAEGGLTEQLIDLEWENYGSDLHLILIEIYVNPVPELRNKLKKIGNYRTKEKAIGIPIVLLQDNFFDLSKRHREIYIVGEIISGLELIKKKVKRNKLDFDIKKLIADVKALLDYNESEFQKITTSTRDTTFTPKSSEKEVKKNFISRLFNR